MTKQTEGGEWKKELDELWNEHDGTHFYKEEFQSLISSLLDSQKEEIRKKVEGMKTVERKGLNLTNYDKSKCADEGYNLALEDIIEILI